MDIPLIKLYKRGHPSLLVDTTFVDVFSGEDQLSAGVPEVTQEILTADVHPILAHQTLVVSI